MPFRHSSWMQGTNRVILRNYEGVITTYAEPKDYTESLAESVKPEGVLGLLKGERISLEPQNLERHLRNAHEE